jgi:hypothetical protein
MSRPGRNQAAFTRTVREAGDMWVGNEAPLVFTVISAKASQPRLPHHLRLSLNEEPIAWTDLHGASIVWL